MKLRIPLLVNILSNVTELLEHVEPAAKIMVPEPEIVPERLLSVPGDKYIFPGPVIVPLRTRSVLIPFTIVKESPVLIVSVEEITN